MHKITDLCSEFSFRKDRLGSYPWLMERPGDRKRVNIIGMGDVGHRFFRLWGAPSVRM